MNNKVANPAQPIGEGAPAIELQGAYKRFATPSGGIYTALANINLTVQRGEFCAVVGPTGCGKSTTLTLSSGGALFGAFIANQ